MSENEKAMLEQLERIDAEHWYLPYEGDGDPDCRNGCIACAVEKCIAILKEASENE